MQQSLSPETTFEVTSPLSEANLKFKQHYPGDSGSRQPVHTVYGGAHLFKADSARKLGTLALRSLEDYAPDFVEFARALGLPGHQSLPKSPAKLKTLAKALNNQPHKIRTSDPTLWQLHTIYQRVLEKLQREPVEDYRIDFEDGYGYRNDSEEDHHAEHCAKEMARGMREQLLPPFIGIRIKPLTEELRIRAIRTLDIFVSTLAHETGGVLPHNFAVTIPKITTPEQVLAAVQLCEKLEAKLSFTSCSISLELMIETPQSIINQRGELNIPHLVAAGGGRLRSLHFGPYDYTALLDITATHQSMQHSACDFARHMMKVALAQTGIAISDGPTHIMPIGVHRAKEGRKLSAKHIAENKSIVHRAWRLAFDNTMHSLQNGIYQGWDLHPTQLPVRYTALYSFFLEGLEPATLRLRTFMEKAAQASMVGDVFDDAATGQGLLNFFLRGIECGAISAEEAIATGLTIEDLRSRSFLRILIRRRNLSK